MSLPAPPESQPPESPAPPDVELFCPACGYSLRGIESDRCPECGFAVDRSAAAVSRIPWEHRRRLGRVRAYWRTMWMPSRDVASDMIRPVNYRAARLYQIVTVLIASLPIAAMAALPVPDNFYQALGGSLSAWPIALPSGWAIDFMLPFLAGAGFRVVVPIAIVLFFLAMTGVASYFFHPPHLTVVQQNRAIALSYYACTPLVLLVLPAIVGWAFLLLAIYKPDWLDRQFMSAAFMGFFTGLVPVVTLLLLWFTTLRMLRAATVCSTARVATMAVTLPIAWALLAVLIIGGLPWLVGYGMIVYWSLQ